MQQIILVEFRNYFIDKDVQIAIHFLSIYSSWVCRFGKLSVTILLLNTPEQSYLSLYAIKDGAQIENNFITMKNKY